MISALLFDLDNTLLENDMDRFLPVYLETMSEFVADHLPPDVFISELVHGTQVMMSNTDPERTLEQVFSETFYPAIEKSEGEFGPILRQYYTEIHPELRELTQPVPGSQALIEHAFELGLAVVVATNPLFPRIAIEQRLEWAGLPTSVYPFHIVTSYECFNFAKPKLEYYAEILGLLGVPPHQAAMIGNDLELDLLPAKELGIAVFKVPHDSLEGIPGGDLAHAKDWISEASEQGDASAIYRPRSILARLRGNLSALRNLTRDVDLSSWTARPAAHEWSPVEVLCHLRDVELEVNIPRMEIILNEKDPFISAADPDQWAEERAYIQQSGPDAMATFTKIRKQITLSTLDQIPEKQWTRKARHALLGPTTLAEIIAVATEHELLHLRQLKDALEACKPS